MKHMVKFLCHHHIVTRSHFTSLKHPDNIVSSNPCVPVAEGTSMSTSELWTKFVSEANGEVNFSLPLRSCVDIPRGTRLGYIADLNHRLGNDKKQSTFHVALVSERNTSKDPASCCSFPTIISQSTSLLNESFRSDDDRLDIAKRNHDTKHFFLSIYGIRHVHKNDKRHKRQATIVSVVSTVHITIQQGAGAWVNYGATTTDGLNRAYTKTAYDGRTFRGRGLFNLLIHLVSSTSLLLTGTARISLQCPSDLVETYKRMVFTHCSSPSLKKDWNGEMKMEQHLVVLQAPSAKLAPALLSPDLVWYGNDPNPGAGNMKTGRELFVVKRNSNMHATCAKRRSCQKLVSRKKKSR